MCHVHPPSHLPVVGRALKLHGQPQSQLHVTSTLPLNFQASATASPPDHVQTVILPHRWSKAVSRDGHDMGISSVLAEEIRRPSGNANRTDDHTPVSAM